MAGKPLKALADQLWKNHGVVLNPLFHEGAKCGAVIVRNDWNNLDVIGGIKSALPPNSDLPPVQGPESCMLADFGRNHEIKVDAAVELLQPTGKIGAQLKEVTDVVAHFDSPVLYYFDLAAAEDLVESTGPAFWNKAIGQAFTDKKTRLVYTVIRGRMSFLFRNSGGIGIDLSGGPMGRLSTFGLDAGWQWRNEATLESKKELSIAVEYAWYDRGRKRFRTDKR